MVKILVSTNDKKVLGLSNPDGYFYLNFLKTCTKIFFFAFVFGAFPIAYFSYATNVRKRVQGKLDEIGFGNESIFDFISLPSTILVHEKIYYLALSIAGLISFVAYYFLYEFCGEMSRFEFQPDQQIMD